jgi:two-component system nitrogen regulation response regulator GlnG/two-component system response regulator HydG
VTERQASSTSEATLPERAESAVISRDASELGVVVAWCASRADAVGAWAPLRAGKWIFGRGLAREDDANPRLRLQRQRPGSDVPIPPLDSPSLSRTQLVFENRSSGAIVVQNVGRCNVLVNGVEAAESLLNEGDVIDIGAQLSFVCVARSPRMRGSPAPGQPFGAPDADGIVGESAAIWHLRDRLSFLGRHTGHVLVLGESGVGKELAACALHRISERPGPFIARNAATIPESLCDAELFGSAEGYPNAGMRERRGLIGAAHRGTLFLDEIGELPEEQQAHLLRVLDSGEFHRLGDPVARRADLRLVAATTRPISALREDLLARFTMNLHVPHLRERREDIPLLLRHLLREMTADDSTLRARFFENDEPRLSQALVRELMRAPPSGNVRALRGVLWSALEQSEGTVLEWLDAAESAPARISNHESSSVEATSEILRLKSALEASGGSLEAARRRLGLSSRFVLMRLMKKHGLRVRKSVAPSDTDV